MTEKNGKPARIWMGTVPESHATLDLFRGLDCKYTRGQLECGESGYKHWQFIVWFGKPVRLSHCRKIGPPTTHWEPTRSEAANEYVWKDDTSAGSRFEFGTKPKLDLPTDWDDIKNNAQRGELDNIPPHVYVRCYNSLRRIATDHMQPLAIERTTKVYWGSTGVGKSRRAWSEASLQAYPKDPRSKFWDGYRGQTCVVIDEFRGGIDISHILRWLDRYPTIVECKGSSLVLAATHIWITSNLDPFYWYPELDSETREALLRRLDVEHIV